MIIKKPADLTASLVLLGGVGLMYHEMRLIEVTTVHAMGPNFFPAILLGLLTVLALCLAFQSMSFGEKEAPSDQKSTPLNMGALTMQLAFVGTLVLYLAVLPYLGYILGTVLFLTAATTLLGERKLKNIAFYLLLSATVTGALYYIFAELLLLFLP